MAEINNDRIFNENIIQVTDNISTADIYWEDVTKLDEDLIHKNNMRILSMCIGRTILDSTEKHIVLYDVAAHSNWEKATLDYIYAIGSNRGICGLYYISLGRVEIEPQELNLLREITAGIKDAAITFDGEWILNEVSNVFSLKTEDNPWIFYISNNGILYRKHGANSAPEKMAEGALLVAAERGYYPPERLELDSDQGLVVCYLKENKELVYRTYAYSSLTGQKEWFAEEIIDTFSAEVKDISIHRLNDYRMGVCVCFVDGEGYKNLWYITDRSYAQMAFRPEHFYIAPAVIHNPIYGYVNYDDNCNILIQPKWEWSINETHDIVTLTSDLTLVYFNDFQTILAANGSRNAIFTTKDATSEIYKIEAVGENQIKVYFSAPLLKDFTLTFNPPPEIDFAAKVNCGSGGGLVKVNATESHLFDISEKIDYNYNETFEITNAVIDSMTIDMRYITTKKFSAAPETFTITNAVIDSMNVEMHAISNIEANPTAETFTITNAVINSITVDSIDIIITIPI